MMVEFNGGGAGGPGSKDRPGGASGGTNKKREPVPRMAPILSRRSIIALTIIIQKLINLRRKVIIRPKLCEMIKKLIKEADYFGATTVCADNPSVMTAIINAAIENRNLNREEVKEAILNFLDHHPETWCWDHNYSAPYGSGLHKLPKGFSRFAMPGVSNIMGCTGEGRIIAFEAKSLHGKITEDKLEFLENIEQCNGIAACVRSLEDVKRILKREL